MDCSGCEIRLAPGSVVLLLPFGLDARSWLRQEDGIPITSLPDGMGIPFPVFLPFGYL